MQPKRKENRQTGSSKAGQIRPATGMVSNELNDHSRMFAIVQATTRAILNGGPAEVDRPHELDRMASRPGRPSGAGQWPPPCTLPYPVAAASPRSAMRYNARHHRVSELKDRREALADRPVPGCEE
jgi:hypothetical protein